MTILANSSLNSIQQKHDAVKLAIAFKRAATDEARNIARQAIVEREVVGRTIRMAPRLRQSYTPDFATPTKRKKEYRSTTGLRSFHFGFSSVTKSSKPRGEPGTKVYANAAANNVIYIEDGAVAHDGHTAYIDSSRVETLPDGDRYAPSNISTIYRERVEFFKLVEKYERDNHGDKATIDFSVNTSLWTAVVADPECDLTVVHAYQTYRTSNNCNRQKISLIGSGAQLRDVMTKHGFVVDNPIPHKERIVRDGFCFHDGRGGRVQYRLVFELPREFNSEQRRQALQMLCDRIKGDGCMYVGVIHAPDSHNDDSNYHIHLDFYDRKCRRLGKNMDNLINVKPHLKPVIAQEIADGLYAEAIEKKAWDFTVKREYQSNKKKKTHRPFAAAHKSDALRGKDYVKTVRERFAEDVNTIAAAAGMSKIYDPRDYAAMGVNAPATNKLGPKHHALEVKGVPTKVGIDNETAQTDFEMSIIERAYQDRSRHLDEVQFYWQNVAEKSPPRLDATKLAVDTEMDKARMANDIRRDLDYLALEQERERSRANLVSQRQWKISKSASASAADVLRSAELEKAADAYIAKLDQQDRALTGNIAELEIFAAAYGAKQLERAITEFGLKMDALGLEGDGQPSADNSLPVKRSIIVRAGILERLQEYRSPAPELDETVLPATATENVVQQAGALLLPPTPEAPFADLSVVAIADITQTATSIPIADMEPVEVAQPITTMTVPPLPTYAESDRKHNTPGTADRANILPRETLEQIDDGDLLGVQLQDATKDVSANLPAQVQPDVEALLEPVHDLPLPTSEPPAS